LHRMIFEDRFERREPMEKRPCEDEYVKVFRQKRDTFNALANILEPKAEDERSRCMVVVARGLAEVCEDLARLRIEELEAEP